MSAKEVTLWKLYKEFQQELEQLKQDMERIAAIRREIAEIGAVSTSKLDDIDIAF